MFLFSIQLFKEYLLVSHTCDVDDELIHSIQSVINNLCKHCRLEYNFAKEHYINKRENLCL